MRIQHLRFHKEGAAGQSITFLVAGAVFIASVSAVIYQSHSMGARIEEAGTEPTEGGAQEGRDLANLLVSSQGMGWADGADSLQRLGLAAGSGNGLDPDRLDLLRDGGLAADPSNGLLDYGEARAALDLDPHDGAQFHVRIYPVGLAGIYQTIDMSRLRTCYVGDWNSFSSVTVPLGSAQDMADAASAGLDADQASWSAKERQIITNLGVGFTDQVHMEPGQPGVTVDMPVGPDVPLEDLVSLDLMAGSVFPDDKQYLGAVLPDQLSHCAYLIVGTGVDQSTLTTAAVKFGIRDWVLDGGTLMVLGSDKQNIQWMQPLFDAGVTTVNGGVYAPDTNHPALREPHDLEWEHYKNYGLAWDVDDKYDDKFQHIIMQGSDDVLAISTEGSFGDGRVFLSTYRPAMISDDRGMGEALKMITNLFIYDDRNDLYLEYGPTIQAEVPVRVSARVSSLPDPLLGQTPVRVEVFTWDS